MKKNILFLFFCLAVFVFANEPTETFDLSTGLPVSGTNWNYDADFYYICEGITGGHISDGCLTNPRNDVPTLFVNDGANLRITGSSTVEQNIRVQVSGTARITLDNANIERTGHSVRIDEPKDGLPAYYITVSPMQLVDNAHLTLTLVGNNTLLMKDSNTRKARWSAGLGVPDGTELVIEGDGKLTAIGGISAAGIGGHQGGVPGTHFGRPAGNITINGGTIIATGIELASGIGNGSNMQGGTITINGGDITASGGSTIVAAGANGGGAGIGGGGSADGAGYPAWCKPSEIFINGGNIKAFGGGGSAGIGSASGGLNTATVNIAINISGGEVHATGGNGIMQGGAGIGGGYYVGGGNITISGGTVTGIGGCYERNVPAHTIDKLNGFGAGIGGGGGTNAGTQATPNSLTMNGNAVVFVSSLENFVGPSASNNSTNITDVTKGILFNGNTSTFYGTSVTPTNDFTIPNGKTLTIPNNATLNILNNITLTNDGTLTNSGTVINCGTIDGNGNWQGNPFENHDFPEGCQMKCNNCEVVSPKCGICDICNPTSIHNAKKINYTYLLKQTIVSEKMEIVLEDMRDIRFSVFDMTGNLVFNGTGKTWDLRNLAGRFVANGTYLVVVDAKDRNGQRYHYSAKLGVKR